MKIVIPNSLNEITLGQYQEFYKLTESTDAKLVERRMIEIFCKVPMKYVNQMKAIDVKEIIQILTQMLENKPSLVNLFKMNGVEYGFIPDLDDMTFGEYVDLDTFIGDTENLHRAMNVLYRPVKIKKNGRYQIVDYDSEKFEDMLSMPMDAVISSILFFYHLGIDYDGLFQKQEREALDAVSNFGRKWGWYQSLIHLAQNDIRRFKDISKLNMHECLTFLTFEKEKNEIEARKIKSKFK